MRSNYYFREILIVLIYILSALTNCLLIEAKAIANTAEKLDNHQVEATFRLLQNCVKSRGKLITSGVGKSGIVARKIAATFSSLGLTSLYLNPLDALHGDLGIAESDDVALVISNSGETREILEIAPHLKRRGIKFIGILGNSNSSLHEICDTFLDSSVDRESCPLNLAPTTSTSVALAIGDALAAVWIERENISRIDFATNHPAGNLGKKLTLKTKDLMIPIKKIKYLLPEMGITKIIEYLTRDGIGACCVFDNSATKKLIGLITDGDLRRTLEKNDPKKWSTLKAKAFMTSDPIIIKEEELAIEALRLMENNRKKSISVLPVYDCESNCTGLLRLHDLIQSGLKDY